MTKRTKKQRILYDYPFSIRHLSKKEGGGYLIEYPDLPGCISDGETVEEAIQNGQDAVTCWLDAAKKSGDPIPSTKAGATRKNAILSIQIEEALKKKGEKILKKIGLTSEKAIYLFYKQICLHNGLPFKIKLPDKKTVKTLHGVGKRNAP